jgi:hypothetical protein
MMTDRRARLAGALAFCAALAGPLAARDVYKGSLDPGIPQHRATLDLLARLDETPNDAALHNDLACLIARDGYWRDALHEFDLAAKLDKKDGRPYYNAGLVHATRGEWRSATSAFRKAVSRTPGNWAGWWMLGYSQERRGNDSAAIAAYKTSLRVDNSLFDVRRNPFAAYTRLKGRVLVEALDGRLHRLALPATEQLAQPDLVTSFQQGRVAVSAVPGAPVPAGVPVPAVASPVEDHTAKPGPGGPVVTSVPPVSSSRPTPAPVVAPRAPLANQPIPSDFPQQSPAGPAPPKRVQPYPAPGPDSPAAPTPTPRPPGPGGS